MMEKALYYELQAPERLVLVEEEETRAALVGSEVAARTLYTAISPGTELAAFSGLPPLRPGPVYPRLVGYCNVAEVLAVGPEAKSLRQGDRIATHQSHRSGFVCDESKILAILPPAADPRLASVTYLFQLGYNALLRAGCVAGHDVAVVGLGVVGLGAVAVARLAGAKVEGFSDHVDPAMGRRFGADRILPKPGSSKTAQAGSVSEGAASYDIVVSTSNKWDDWKLALDLVRPRGKIATLGFPGRGEPGPDFNPLASRFLYDKQLEILGCGLTPDADVDISLLRFNLKTGFAYLLNEALAGRLPSEAMIEGIMPSSALEAAYRRLLSGERGVGTLVLDWT